MANIKFNPPVVYKYLTIFFNLDWQVSVTGLIVPAVDNFYVSLPQVISSYNDFMSIIEKLHIASVYTGNPDQHLVDTVQK